MQTVTMEQYVRTKIHNHVAAEFDEEFDASIVLLRRIEEPNRFEGPVYLAVVRLLGLEEDIAATLAHCDPEDLEQVKKHLMKGNEVACVFSNSGEEMERHFRGIDYIFHHKNIEL